MSKFNFQNYKRGIITLEIQTFHPEKFINLLWKNGVSVKNIKKKSITTIAFQVSLKDYGVIRDIAKRTGTKIKIVGRKGLSFLIIKTQNRKTLVIGVAIFVGIIYYLSGFVWNINVTTENNVTPYEIRNQLKHNGINIGMRKDKINVYNIEEKIVQDNPSIMWARVRVEGVKLNVSVAERQEPPSLAKQDVPCNIVASKDGEIGRIYSTAGTAIVKEGDIVKKGDILVKGEQGKEESTYLVHAAADVIARTFYEAKNKVPIKTITKKKTGNEDKDVYLELFGKKLYIKKAKNNFKTYDKIYKGGSILKQNIYSEVITKEEKKDSKEVVDKTANELFSNIIVKLDKSVKIVDKIVNSDIKGDNYEVRVVLVVEENIAEEQSIEGNIGDTPSKEDDNNKEKEKTEQ
ncbi:sporulation protein YqfD [Clostridium botulinum]|uniref:Stage IV sporulation protein n=1 Tax=Clostridium botulinum TaxID=1491 RepID=A0A9Q1UZZ7_CLOBO|nr:sporulation protein YqfD [Clostridium botulinum]AEB76498.1 stage IV sporulation protein, putative [Clostridium botulinum BKT015925]KEH97476.1 stage IV sporulation protein [Clostridium botulinum D str. 16868]KEI03451.1 stage IV sporulation protein [Clostridium botulinum C/D str. Sp77]KLU76120.1 stage IV sporulation protein [Clostridium botulinum V891]KOA74053.1 stage IV sporulation protein [Clostridium botulinum]